MLKWLFSWHNSVSLIYYYKIKYKIILNSMIKRNQQGDCTRPYTTSLTIVSRLLVAVLVHLPMILSLHFLWIAALHSVWNRQIDKYCVSSPFTCNFDGSPFPGGERCLCVSLTAHELVTVKETLTFAFVSLLVEPPAWGKREKVNGWAIFNLENIL